MRFQILFYTFILSLLFILTGCGDQPAANNATANKTVNADKPANSNNTLATNKAPETSTTNNAPTIAPVVQSYQDALRKKDDAALRKIFAAASLKTAEADMKSEKKTSLSAFISELEPAPEKPFEVRNEKIEGDTATAEIRGGAYANWTPYKFVKENGEWKWTGSSPDFDAIKK
jgi:hypothetical protein